MRVRRIHDLGYHNCFSAGRCLHAEVDAPPAGQDPLPPALATLLREELGDDRELAAQLDAAVPEGAALAGALAAVLQAGIYPGPWRSGGLPPDRGTASFFFEYAELGTARLCLQTAIELASRLLDAAAEPPGGAAAALRGVLNAHRQKQFEVALNRNTRDILQEAEARGIPWSRIWEATTHVQLGQGRKLRRFHSMMTDLDSVLGAEMSHNKFLTLRLLAAAQLPVPKAAQLGSAEQAVAMARRLGYPVVIKPNALLQGTGVSVNLKTDEEVRRAYVRAAEFGAGVNIETLIPGDDHRILVVAGRFVAAARREPARVVGDGRRNIRELIAAENENPLRQHKNNDVLSPIKADEETERLLAGLGMTLDSVPAAGRSVALKATANISSGGTATDVTESIHPDNVAMAERAARLLDVEVGGIDYITTDIARSHRETGGAICEVNTWVSLSPHRAANPERDVISPLVDRVFPPGDDGRIPIAAVAGPGAGAAVEAVEAILAAAGVRVGRAGSGGVAVGGQAVSRHGHADRRGGEMVLGDPGCDTAVLEIDLERMPVQGLAFDRCSIAALLGGPAAVAERERAQRRLLDAASGACVLDAEAPETLTLAGDLKGRELLLAAPNGRNEALKAHLKSGGRATLLAEADGGPALQLCQDGEETTLLTPAALSGVPEAARRGLAFAAAIAAALGQDAEAIAAGLQAYLSEKREPAQRAV